MSEFFEENSSPCKKELLKCSINNCDIFIIRRICSFSGIYPSIISLNSLKEMSLRQMSTNCVLHTMSKSLSVISPNALYSSSLKSLNKLEVKQCFRNKLFF